MMRMEPAAVIPALSADSDTISDSGSSASVPPPQPMRNQDHSVSQVARADGAPVAVEEVTSQAMVEGGSSSAVAGTALNRYLRAYGRIPMTFSEVLDVDLNALAPPDSRPLRRQVYRPVICAYCNCAFCFGDDEVSSLDLGPGHVYPAPPSALITLNLLTPPPVWPLYRDVPRGPGSTPECLLVCSCKHHFMATMGMLQQQPGGAPPLEWRGTICCLRVRPVVVGSEGSNSPDLRAIPAPPLEPWRYAGAYWNYVVPGHENMVELKLHDDPLKLTLGRP